MSVTQHQIVAFRLGEEEYAFGVADVHEITGPALPRPVPSSDPWCGGSSACGDGSSPGGGKGRTVRVDVESGQVLVRIAQRADELIMQGAA
jgi:hypothetical protein